MAEVATNVLHNVGNVLNSVNVSAEAVAGKVREFRIGNLRNVATLLPSPAESRNNCTSKAGLARDVCKGRCGITNARRGERCGMANHTMPPTPRCPILYTSTHATQVWPIRQSEAIRGGQAGFVR